MVDGEGFGPGTVEEIRAVKNHREIEAGGAHPGHQIHGEDAEEYEGDDPDRGSSAGPADGIAEDGGFVLAGADAEPFDEVPELLTFEDDEAGEFFWPDDEGENSESDAAEEDGFERSPGEAECAAAEAVENGGGEMIGSCAGLEGAFSWGELAHEWPSREAQRSGLGEVSRSVEARVKDEPHRRQKLACGGFIARQRMWAQRRGLVEGRGARLARPVRWRNAIQTARKTWPMIQRTKSSQARARIANTPKMWKVMGPIFVYRIMPGRFVE